VDCLSERSEFFQIHGRTSSQRNTTATPLCRECQLPTPTGRRYPPSHGAEKEEKAKEITQNTRKKAKSAENTEEELFALSASFKSFFRVFRVLLLIFCP
jgi:hypothetical protein